MSSVHRSCERLRTFLPAGISALVFALLSSPAPLRADGPGLGNLTYTAGEYLSTVARFDSTNGVPLGQGFVTMHRGYLVVPFSADGGGGNGTGGFSFFNVGNPKATKLFFTTSNNPAYDASSPNYPGNMREPHGYSFTRFGGKDYACFPTNISGANASGLQVWDFTDMDTPAPKRVSQIGLAGLNGGDYSPTPWWVCWQGGRYAYVAGTSGGLFIVDLSNPAVPTVVATRTPSQLGFPSGGVNTAFAVGNLLVLTGSQPSEAETITGLATYDISNPANPVLLDYESDLAGYSAMVNGNRIYGARDPARVWNIANPANITLVGVGPDVATKGGYGTFQDGYFLYGSSSAFVKLNVSSVPFTVEATNSPTGFNNPDWDFATALGNLVFQGNDHSGSALVVQKITPDTTGPSVNMISPKSGAVSCALTSRVGVTFTDLVDLRSIDPTTFSVGPEGGAALPGRYSHQTGIVNFWPDAPLQANTTYVVRIAAGGVKDFAGNGVPTEFISYFSTGATITPLTVTGQGSGAATPGATVNFTASGSGAGTLEYSWNFGDGSAATTFSSSPNASHAYAAAGHYAVTVTLRNGSGIATSSTTQTVHRPLAAGLPASSGPILFDPSTNRVWCVNPDADSVTAIDAAGLGKLFETSVGKHPRTLARSPGGAIWVVNQDDATISVLNPSSGAVTNLIPLPRASRPYGIAFTPNGSAAWVSTEGTGSLLKLDPATGAMLGSQSFAAPLRGLAITADSARLFVTRFLSRDAQGEIYEVNPATLAPVRTLTLPLDPGPDTEASGRGLPNFLTAAAISPDGLRLWIPAKKDNIQRGLARDGLPLTFENTVRTIVAQLDLATNSEPAGTRIDFNDRDLAQAVAFSPLGDFAYVVAQGSDTLSIVDAYSGALAGGIDNLGLSPQGLVFNPAGTRLFVQNFMSRNVSVFDTSGIVNASSTVATPLANVSTVAVEPLPPAVLLGKQIFYNAGDDRMNQDGYLSCASCHLDAGSDGRVWDFTDRGEGLRRTPSLAGHGGMAQGRVHWSANFDEIQDFEGDIRGPFGGLGFMTDAQFNTGTRSQPLGDPKAGVSTDLDALAAYLSSLTTTPPSPFRQANGALDPDAAAGRELFVKLSCFACHSGPAFTDSPATLLHNVGTITTASGHRLGGALPGIDTPTLKGVWQNRRYLHDGSAATLLDVITTANPSGLHGVTANLTPAERLQLVAYLKQIDDTETAPTVGAAATLVAPAPGGIFATGAAVRVAAEVTDGPGAVDRVEFYRNGALLAQDSSPPFETTWAAATPGLQTFSARVVFASGLVTTTEDATIRIGALAPVPVRVNFQPAGSPVPAGYVADTGSVYADRGNGYSYGWTTDLSSRTRDRDINADQRYDTLCHMRLSTNGTNQTWEIALPNGTYNVFGVFGDPGFTDFVNNVQIEGIDRTDGVDANFNEFTATCTVTDGRLTITPGTSAQNPRICFIDISPPPPPTVTITAVASATGERAAAPGMFRVTRSGAATSGLTVRLASGGSATNGVDYAAVASQVLIPTGQSSVDIPITPALDDMPEGDESVVLTLGADPAYAPGASTSATVTIADAPIDFWKRQHFAAPARVTPAIGGDLGDPNADGVANLLEYALGRDPLAPQGSPTTVSEIDPSGHLTLSFQRPLSASDVSYAIEGTANLGAGWLSDAGHIGIALSNNPDGVTQTVTATWLGADPAAFMRLRVQRP